MLIVSVAEQGAERMGSILKENQLKSSLKALMFVMCI